jgi:hypothetical protein
VDYLEVMQNAFFDELENIDMVKEATAGALYQGVKGLGGKLLSGANYGQLGKYLGARAGIGAGVGAVAGGATSQDGNFARGVTRGALAGGAIGAGVGGAQIGRAAYRSGQYAMGQGSRAGMKGVGSTLQSAGLTPGAKSFRQAAKAQKTWSAPEAAAK